MSGLQTHILGQSSQEYRQQRQKLRVPDEIVSDHVISRDSASLTIITWGGVVGGERGGGPHLTHYDIVRGQVVSDLPTSRRLQPTTVAHVSTLNRLASTAVFHTFNTKIKILFCDSTLPNYARRNSCSERIKYPAAEIE